MGAGITDASCVFAVGMFIVIRISMFGFLITVLK